MNGTNRLLFGILPIAVIFAGSAEAQAFRMQSTFATGWQSDNIDAVTCVDTEGFLRCGPAAIHRAGS